MWKTLEARCSEMIIMSHERFMPKHLERHLIRKPTWEKPRAIRELHLRFLCLVPWYVSLYISIHFSLYHLVTCLALGYANLLSPFVVYPTFKGNRGNYYWDNRHCSMVSLLNAGYVVCFTINIYRVCSSMKTFNLLRARVKPQIVYYLGPSSLKAQNRAFEY